MDKTFDFNKVGKKMPYTMPDRFFDDMEEEVMARVDVMNAKKRRRKTVALRWMMYAASVAACIILTITTFMPKQFSAEEWNEKELCAFDQLPADDQDYILEVYDDDIFLHEFNQ